MPRTKKSDGYAERLATKIATEVDKAPPLTDAQKDALRVLLTDASHPYWSENGISSDA